MPKAVDRDELLASLHDELRTSVNTLNELYHPVYPADPDRTKRLEARLAELRAAIAERRAELTRAADA